VNTSRLKTHVLAALLSLGVVFALHYTTVLVVRTVLLDMIRLSAPISEPYLPPDTKSKSSVRIQI
jgi:hypothetical protein